MWSINKTVPLINFRTSLQRQCWSIWTVACPAARASGTPRWEYTRWWRSLGQQTVPPGRNKGSVGDPQRAGRTPSGMEATATQLLCERPGCAGSPFSQFAFTLACLEVTRCSQQVTPKSPESDTQHYPWFTTFNSIPVSSSASGETNLWSKMTLWWPKVSWGFPHSSVGKESACNVEDLGSIPGSGRPSGEGNGNPLQYSCLENPMDRGAWWAKVHGAARVGHNLVTKPNQTKVPCTPE